MKTFRNTCTVIVTYPAWSGSRRDVWLGLDWVAGIHLAYLLRSNFLRGILAYDF